MHLLELQDYLRTLTDEGRLPQTMAVGVLQSISAQQMTHPVYKLQPAMAPSYKASTLGEYTQPFTPLWIKCKLEVEPWGASQATGDWIVDRLLGEPSMQPYLIRPVYQDHRIHIEPFIETFDDNPAAQPRPTDNDRIRQVAQVLSTVHRLKPSNINVAHRPLIQYFNESLAQVAEIASHLGISSNTLAAMESYLRNLPNLPWFEDTPKALCHFDPTPGNWLWPIDSAVPKLIDWEYAAFSNPWVDLAVVVDAFQLDHPQALYFISCYWDTHNKSITPSATEHKLAEQSLTTLKAWVQLVRRMSQLWAWLEQHRTGADNPKTLFSAS